MSTAVPTRATISGQASSRRTCAAELLGLRGEPLDPAADAVLVDQLLEAQLDEVGVVHAGLADGGRLLQLAAQPAHLLAGPLDRGPLERLAQRAPDAGADVALAAGPDRQHLADRHLLDGGQRDADRAEHVAEHQVTPLDQHPGPDVLV